MARLCIRTDHVDGSSAGAVGARALPICEVEVLVLHAAARLQLELGPVRVNVEGVRVLVPDEVGEGAVADGA